MYCICASLRTQSTEMCSILIGLNLNNIPDLKHDDLVKIFFDKDFTRVEVKNCKDCTQSSIKSNGSTIFQKLCQDFMKNRRLTLSHLSQKARTTFQQLRCRVQMSNRRGSSGVSTSSLFDLSPQPRLLSYA